MATMLGLALLLTSAVASGDAERPSEAAHSSHNLMWSPGLTVTRRWDGERPDGASTLVAAELSLPWSFVKPRFCVFGPACNHAKPRMGAFLSPMLKLGYDTGSKQKILCAGASVGMNVAYVLIAVGVEVAYVRRWRVASDDGISLKGFVFPILFLGLYGGSELYRGHPAVHEMGLILKVPFRA